MAQAFLTYEQQINLLQNDKELSICDSDFAKTILQKISYYSLIDGYKEPFKPLRSGKFYYGVTFEEIFSSLIRFSCSFLSIMFVSLFFELLYAFLFNFYLLREKWGGR